MHKTEHIGTIRRSEYGDKVEKLNRKEDILLERHLKVIERQRRVAENAVLRTLHEAEKINSMMSKQKDTVTARSNQKEAFVDDWVSSSSSFQDFGSQSSDWFPTFNTVRLPPLWQRPTFASECSGRHFGGKKGHMEHRTGLQTKIKIT